MERIWAAKRLSGLPGMLLGLGAGGGPQPHERIVDATVPTMVRMVRAIDDSMLSVVVDDVMYMERYVVRFL